MSNRVLLDNYSVSEVSSSDVVDADRFDAEYFDPDYLENNKIISSIDTASIADLVSISDGNHLSISDSFTNDTDSVPYYRGQDINSIFIESTEPVRIPRDIYSKNWMKRSVFMPGDILLSIVGTIGSLSFVPKDSTDMCGSCKIAILRPKDYIQAKAIMVFLISKYGQFQLKRNTRGAVQMGIILADIPKIVIPKFSNRFVDKIDTLIDECFDLEKKSREYYNQANDLFLKSINLKNYKSILKSQNVKFLEEVKSENRFDAEYWQPKYIEIESLVSEIKQIELGKIVDVKKGIEPGSDAYEDEGEPFIRVSDFSIYGISETEKKISSEMYDKLKDQYSPKADEILFTKDGTIGLTYACHEPYEGILSGAFLRLTPKININQDYLALALNAKYSKAQIERMSGGAIIAHIKPEDVKKIKIPILSDVLQNDIGNKMTSSFRLRKSAFNILEKTKKAVEIYVDKGENEAFNYLSN